MTPESLKNSVMMQEGAPVTLKGGHKRTWLALAFYGTLIALPVLAIWWGSSSLDAKAPKKGEPAAPVANAPRPSPTKATATVGITAPPETNVRLVWLAEHAAGLLINDDPYTLHSGDTFAGVTLGRIGMQWADVSVSKQNRRLWIPERTVPKTDQPGGGGPRQANLRGPGQNGAPR